MTFLCAIDFESAGALPGKTDVPVQIGLAKTNFILNNTTTPEFLWSSYIFPDRPIHWKAAKVHGITDEQVQNSPRFFDFWPILNQHLSNCILVGHNVSTEKRFLRTFPGHKFGPWLDSLTLMRKIYPQLSDHSLSSCCQALGLTEKIHAWIPNKTWHDALFDAVASLAIIRELTTRLDLGICPIETLLHLK